MKKDDFKKLKFENIPVNMKMMKIKNQHFKNKNQHLKIKKHTLKV